MRRIEILALGGIKEQFIKDGIAQFSKRLSRFCNFSVKEVLKEGDLLNSISGYCVLFDREGEAVSSEDLANIIQPKSKIQFIIGESEGVSDVVKKAVDKKISFGKVTYPHRLFRLIATEQIYRAFTILENMPYHK